MAAKARGSAFVNGAFVRGYFGSARITPGTKAGLERRHPERADGEKAYYN
jgi:hypothetical protein